MWRLARVLVVLSFSNGCGVPLVAGFLQPKLLFHIGLVQPDHLNATIVLLFEAPKSDRAVLHQILYLIPHPSWFEGRPFAVTTFHFGAHDRSPAAVLTVRLKAKGPI